VKNGAVKLEAQAGNHVIVSLAQCETVSVTRHLHIHGIVEAHPQLSLTPLQSYSLHLGFQQTVQRLELVRVEKIVIYRSEIIRQKKRQLALRALWNKFQCISPQIANVVRAPGEARSRPADHVNDSSRSVYVVGSFKSRIS